MTVFFYCGAVFPRVSCIKLFLNRELAVSKRGLPAWSGINRTVVRTEYTAFGVSGRVHRGVLTFFCLTSFEV